jgi:DNA-binding GntR family transcriptional regulator
MQPQSHEPEGTIGAPAGRRPAKRLAVVDRMKRDIESRRFTLTGLSAMKQEALAVEYRVSRWTALKALELLRSEFCLAADPAERTA